MKNVIDEKRVTFNYDQLALYSETDIGLFCLSDRDLSMILSCLRVAMWSARWYGDDGKRLRETGRQADLEIAITYTERLIDRLMTDSCNDLAQTFDNLITALQQISSPSAGCGCGSAGAGSTDVGGSVSDWGDINDPPDPDTPPDGFDTWTEYRTYKCDVATQILNNLISDIQWFKSVDLVSMTLVGLALGLLTPVPGDEMFALLTVLIAISGLGAALLDDAEDSLTNHYDDLLCALYQANNASQAETDFKDTLHDAIDTEADNIANAAYLKLMFDLMTNFISINRLFDRDLLGEGSLPTGDCSDCGVPQWWDCLNGTVVEYGESYVEVEAVAVGADYLASIGCHTSPKDFTVDWVSGTWSTPASGPTFVTARENDPSNVTCGAGSGSPWDYTASSIVLTGHTNTTELLFRSGDPFNVRFNI